MKVKLCQLIILLVYLSTSVNAQTLWTNPLKTNNPSIHGRYWNEANKENYYRLPPKAKEKVRSNLWNLSQESAGLSVKFNTNASDITIRFGVNGGYSMPHMPSTGVSGVDMYRVEGNQYLWSEGSYSFGDTITYVYKNLKPNSEKDSEYQLFLPLYNRVNWLEIGINEKCNFQFTPVDTSQASVVVYGTSIAQGACASRPGMAWTNILSRMLNQPIINLGFSGNGKLESEVFELLAEIKTSSIYIIDCMPNMYDHVDEIRPRIKEGLNILRSKSDAPILLVEHCGYNGSGVSATRENDYTKTNIELRQAYDDAIIDNIDNIYYLSYDEINLSNDSQVDGIHASDLGMYEYAVAYEKKVKEITQSVKNRYNLK